MHKLLLQFHAAPQEIAAFLCDVIQQGLSVVIMTRVPLSIELVTEADIDPNRLQTVTEIGIVRRPLESVPQSWDGFLVDHHDALFLRVGRLENHVLAQSWLSSQSSSEAVIKRWRKVADVLMKRTTAGVWVTNPATNAGGFYKQFRFTAGALALFDNGYRMAPAAGTNIVHLRAPVSDSPSKLRTPRG